MTPKEVVSAFHAAFVARDVDALCALYADDSCKTAPSSRLVARPSCITREPAARRAEGARRPAHLDATCAAARAG